MKNVEEDWSEFKSRAKEARKKELCDKYGVNLNEESDVDDERR